MTEMTFADAWHKICAAYANPAVAALCLDLQDRFAVDVPLLLFLAVVERGELGPSDDALADFISAARSWQAQVIAPIRTVRQAMKHQFTAEPEAALRDRVKELELEAERQHVRRLAEAWRPTFRRTTPSAHFYLRHCKVPSSQIDGVFEMLSPKSETTRRAAAQ